MDNRLLSLYLSRILSGEYIFIYNDIKYILIYPDKNVKYAAELYAHELYDTNKYYEWISDEDIIYWLIDAGLWSTNGDKILSELEKQIENHKVDLYNNFLNPSKLKSIRRSLSSAKKQYNKLYNIRHSLDYITLSGYCNSLKNEFILLNSLYDIDKILINKNNLDHNFISNIANFINENIIDISTFRLLARNEIWRSYWSANKDFVFNKAVTDWTDEQKTLVVISKMYDSAYEHPECPVDSVIEDDDMFDGWMIIQKRENEKNKKANRNNKMLEDKKIGNAKEVFLVANSKEEAQNIYDLNDPQSRNIIKERNRIILNSSTDIPEAELPDVQRDLVIQNNKQFMQSRKK